MGFKIDKPRSTTRSLRKAMVMAVDQGAIAKNLYFGEVEPAYSYISQQALDWNKKLDADADQDQRRRGQQAARRGRLGEAAPTASAPQRQEDRADALRLHRLDLAEAAEAVQGDLRKVGIDMKMQLFDATVAWGKLATQEFDMFGMSYPYISAGDALNLYFRSANVPTPNRMNWKDAKTDELLTRA